MGYEEIPQSTPVIFRDFSAGWFPGKEHNDIPGSLKTKEPIGMFDGNAVIWYDGALRSMFGYDNVNTVALNSGAAVTSLYASDVISKFVTSVGNKLYTGADQASPTDITGIITLTAGSQIQWSEWQFEDDAYIVGTNGVDAPIKYTGTGNASALGGSPPTARWSAVFNNALFLARTSLEPSTVFFSNLGDPEVYTSDDDYKFNAPITGLAVLGKMLVVFKSESIGVLSGFNNSTLTKEENYISGKGCSGGHTIVQAKLKGRDVLIFHGYDGWYAFDGSKDLIYLSYPVRNKYRPQASVPQFTQSRFQYAWAEYIPQYEWVITCLSDGADTTNNFVVILDLGRVYESSEGVYVPHWPVDNIPGNCIARSKRITSENNEIFFGDTTGFVYKFTPTGYNYNGSVYTKFFESKIFDNILTWVLVEFNIMGNEGSVSSDTYIKSDLEIGDGTQGSANLSDGGDVLGTTFILGTSELGGKDFVFVDATTDAFGRFLQFKISNSVVDKSFSIEEVNLILQEIGLDTNAAQI